MTDEEISAAIKAGNELDRAAEHLREAGLDYLATKVETHKGTVDRILLGELKRQFENRMLQEDDLEQEAE